MAIMKLRTEVIKELFLLAESAVTLSSLDQLLSIGERLSTVIMTEFLKQMNIKAVIVDAREIITTNDNFGEAKPKLNNIRINCHHKIKPKLKNHLIITQGFVGCTTKGMTTTLGREGSDYTAALIAEALNADLLKIYTDVKGVFTGDPKLIPNAKFIPNLSYQNMTALSKFGANVLHHNTILPCMRVNIPVLVQSTFNPKNIGTFIYKNTNEFITNNRFIAITSKSNYSILDIELYNNTNLFFILKLLNYKKIKIEFFLNYKDNIKIIIKSNDFSIDSIIFYIKEKLSKKNYLSKMNLRTHFSLITLIGNHTNQSLVLLKAFLDSINFSRFVIYCEIDFSNISLLVHDKYMKFLIQLLHEKFFESIGQY